MWSFQALVVFVILLPGFFSRLLITILIPRKKTTDLHVIIESLILSFIVYASALVFYPSAVDRLLSQAINPQVADLPSGTMPMLIYSVCVSIVLGLALGLLLNYDLLHRALRFFKLTSSTGRSSTWLDVFSHMAGRSIIVTLKNGRRIMGHPEIYSPCEEEGIIFLARPKWIDNQGKYKSCQIRGILLMPHDIVRIEFLLSKTEYSEANHDGE
jgi:hypothetical protein